MASTSTRWWWVRHAPVINHDGKIYGQKDVSCDTSNSAAFSALAAMLPGDAVWVTSHLNRTTETANAIRDAGLTAPDYIVEPDLAEQNFGDWQQKSWDQLHAEETAEYKAFWDNPGYSAPPGGESFADLQSRVTAAVGRLNAQHGGRDIIAVSHGGVIRAAVSMALETEPLKALAVTVDNLTLTRLDHIAEGIFQGQGGVWRVAGVNLPPVGTGTN
ncbi:MAG: histidine phosphatase family protein [Rhodospirillaceae bacterium]|jgi:alpha-ribazole phosphatase|nr:histidine phosphatase family protein [Rhodospirillaceae bacterium]MBT4219522.1 histidine phosphatase family protein [Rhodospirillaceae bacterium]MBT4464288.1 histidine phosphatase family protein [Rhodospirillaceae bacterium]MBT5309627.1 histidine phosphatase family protein [Rhodospirillaceae bacterium]MBT6406164.1 histidine phosphatase family protein [Rhodospirillaceae bacterium]